MLLGDAIPPQPHGSRPSSLPRWTAWVRRAAPSLSKAREQCVLTVFSETKSCVAISRLLKPRATRVRISSSRAVMPRVCWLAASGAKGTVLGKGAVELPRRQAPPSPRPFREWFRDGA